MSRDERVRVIQTTRTNAEPTGVGAADLKRATYYLRPEQIKALKLTAVHQERNLSDVVREAVDRYLRLRGDGPQTAPPQGSGQPDDILFCG